MNTWCVKNGKWKLDEKCVIDVITEKISLKPNKKKIQSELKTISFVDQAYMKFGTVY